MVNTNEKYMNRCLEIAQNGKAAAKPNPSVGAVIVCNDRIIGEGFTAAYGGHHAEVNAIKSVKNKMLLATSTLFVSLEPCSHFGKTAPCSDLIIQSGIPNIVVGCLDNNPKVAGKGIQKLLDAGRNVLVGVLEEACIVSNNRFYCFHKKKRPFIILKWAESQDGFIAPTLTKIQDLNNRKPFWISNTISRQLVHKWRGEVQAILVGTQTVVDDNPRLDCRDWFGKNPVRIVLDQHQRISNESHVYDNQAETIVFTGQRNKLTATNSDQITIDFSANIATQITDELYKRNIQSVLIEGGLQTLQTFIDANLWDEAYIFKGSILLENGIKAPTFKCKKTSKQYIGNDELLICRNHD